jgi:hypothetical protein
MNPWIAGHYRKRSKARTPEHLPGRYRVDSMSFILASDCSLFRSLGLLLFDSELTDFRRDSYLIPAVQNEADL